MTQVFFALISKGHGNRDVSLWLPLWMTLLACGWLLPNHVVPWPAFHHDAWTSMMFVFAGLAIVLPYKNDIHWIKPAIYGVAFSVIPWIQYSMGIIEYFGLAWIAFLYIIGFSLTIQFGYTWQKNVPNQGLSLVCSAILIAGILNSGIIFLQISNTDLSGYIPWVVEPMGPRPFGNFAQPNNMATFILLSMLSAVWLFQEAHIRRSILATVIILLFFALISTQSRTSLVALMVIVSFIYFKTEQSKRQMGGKRLLWFSIPVLTFFLMWMIPLVFGQHPDDAVGNLISRTINEKRMIVYGLFLDATVDRFWLGYGINQGATAQMHAALNHPSLEGFYFHSHNILIDMLVWLGTPLGLMAGLIIIYFIYRLVRKTDNYRQMILQCMILVLIVHAMLELPLYYAFFLIPFGFIIGALLEMQRIGPSVSMSRPVWLTCLLIFFASLTMTIQSYLGVEESYSVLRQRGAKFQGAFDIEIKSNHWPVDQFNDHLQTSMNKFEVNLSENELMMASKSNMIYPSYHNLLLEAKALALAGNIASAQIIINKLSKLSTKSQYTDLKQIWQTEAYKHANTRAVLWEITE